MEFSSQCKWFGHQQLPVEHIQVTVGTPLSPPRSGNFKLKPGWLPSVCSEETQRSNSLLHNTRVFLHREHHISCNISSSHGALMTSVPEQQGSPQSLPALSTCQAAAPAMPCFSLQEVQLISFFFFHSPFLSCIKPQIPQIRLVYILIK